METNKFFRALDAFINAIVYTDCLLEIAVGGALSLLLTVEVFCRYVLQSSLLFSEELSRMLFIWFALLGATIALHEGAHIGFDLVKMRFKGQFARAVSIVSCLVVLFYCAFICYGCVTILPKQVNQMYAVLKISRLYSYLSVAVGMAFLFLRAAYTLLCTLAGRKENLRTLEEMFAPKKEEC